MDGTSGLWAHAKIAMARLLQLLRLALARMAAGIMALLRWCQAGVAKMLAKARNLVVRFFRRLRAAVSRMAAALMRGFARVGETIIVMLRNVKEAIKLVFAQMAHLSERFDDGLNMTCTKKVYEIFLNSRKKLDRNQS